VRRIDLPGGHWADLREPGSESGNLRDDLTVYGKRGIERVSGRLSMKARVEIGALQEMEAGPAKDAATLGLDLSEADQDAFTQVADATLAALLAGWSLDLPLPQPNTVGDMPSSIYEALTQAVAAEAAASTDLSLDMSVGDGSPDPKGPSGGSKPSSTRSKGPSRPRPTRK
jgi:hypothetical protein